MQNGSRGLAPARRAVRTGAGLAQGASARFPGWTGGPWLRI
ncbi:uncharacterized protein METZ01_LOCUS249826 [marine metagenome]|uniref:Uncharacterized protein n=1 Tax=marine metagenome TaxID=408172 RepID=A0A382ICF8_9ZZZZ